MFWSSSPEAGSPFFRACDMQCLVFKVKYIPNGITFFQVVMVIKFAQSVDAVKLRHAKPWRVGALVDNDDVVRYASVFRSVVFRQEEHPVFNLDLIQLFGAFCCVFHCVVVKVLMKKMVFQWLVPTRR